MQVDRAMLAERSKQARWMFTSAGKSVREAETAKIMFVKSFDACFQEFSLFDPIIDLSDGCIHFIRLENLAAKPQVAAANYNLDSLLTGEAEIIAADHYGARKACELREDMLAAQTAEWKAREE